MTTLTPGMSKAEFEKATGLKVAYRSKGKTGISFKPAKFYNMASSRIAERRAEAFRKQFSGCTVKVLRSATPGFPFPKAAFSVRVVVPLA